MKDRSKNASDAVRRHAGTAVNRNFLARMTGFQPVHDDLPGDLGALLARLDGMPSPAPRAETLRRR